MYRLLKSLKDSHTPIVVLGSTDVILGSGYVMDICLHGDYPFFSLFSEVGQKFFINPQSVSSFYTTLVPEMAEAPMEGAYDLEDGDDEYYV